MKLGKIRIASRKKYIIASLILQLFAAWNGNYYSGSGEHAWSGWQTVWLLEKIDQKIR